MGLSTGLFAATAIALSSSLSSLLPIAVQMALMAFRAGVHVAALGGRLYRDTDSSESWTYELASSEESDMRSILEDFHTSHVSLQDSLNRCHLANRYRAFLQPIMYISAPLPAPALSLAGHLQASSDFWSFTHSLLRRLPSQSMALTMRVICTQHMMLRRSCI